MLAQMQRRGVASNIDSFDVTQTILLLGRQNFWQVIKGSQHYNGWEPLI